MEGVRPCPYCKGEVEVIRMPDLDKQKTYRISCKRCGALVVRGQGFPIETLSDAEDRINDYERFMEKQFSRK